MKLERAEYESQLAQRRYEEVDPANRLVAATIEKRWNETLLELENIKEQYIEYQKKDLLPDPKKHKDNILSIAKDFPKLWNATTTTSSDKKRILRLVINDITVEKLLNNREIVLHIRWYGGAIEDIVITIPNKLSDKWRHSESTINAVRMLAPEFNDKQIATELNNLGLRTNKGNIFTPGSIKWIRYKHNMPFPKVGEAEELTVKEVMKKFNVTDDIVYYWIKCGIVMARHINNSKKLWIIVDKEKEYELNQIVAKKSK